MLRNGPRGWSRVVSVAAAVGLLSAAAPAPRTSQAPLPAAKDVIDRYLQASGGAAAFKAVRSIRARGKLTIPSQNMAGDIETLAARPNKSLARLNLPGVGRIEEGFDGKIGWSMDPISGPSLVTGRALKERTDESWFDAPLHAPDYVREMIVVGREEFDRRPAYRLKVTLVSGTEQFELFDTETGLQIGLEATRETPFGSAPTTTVFRDYQKRGALQLPLTQMQRILGIEQVVTFSSYEFNVVSNSAFDLPAPIRALVK